MSNQRSQSQRSTRRSSFSAHRERHKHRTTIPQTVSTHHNSNMAEAPKVNVKSFHGKGGQSATSFLDLCERMSHIYKLKEEDQVERFPLYLEPDSPASTWYFSQSKDLKHKFGKLSEAFLERFEPTQVMRHSLCRELRGQKFSSGEDLEAFVDNIVRQGRMLGLTDRLIMDEILMALPTDMANTISQHDPKTVEDIIRRARYTSQPAVSGPSPTATPAATPATTPAADIHQLVAAVGQFTQGPGSCHIRHRCKSNSGNREQCTM